MIRVALLFLAGCSLNPAARVEVAKDSVELVLDLARGDIIGALEEAEEIIAETAQDHQK